MDLSHIRFGWKPELADHRDLYYGAPFLIEKAPDHVDTLAPDWVIEDQGAAGSCTGCSSTSAMEIALHSTKHYSKLMAYYDGRDIEHTTDEDSGAQIRDVMKALQKIGVCDESLWPYDLDQLFTRPNDAAYEDARQVIPLISSYQRIIDLHGIKVALSHGLPVTFGFMVPDYMMSDEVAKSGWLRAPRFYDSILGGHAVVAVGYEDRAPEPYVMVRNSWGAAWGNPPGHFRMSQAWWSGRRLVDDMWVITPRQS